MLHTMFCRVNKLFTILCFTACLVIVNTWQAFVVLATILMIQGIFMLRQQLGLVLSQAAVVC